MMKKIYLTLLGLITLSASAQNTLPNAGNIGIGTISPVANLHVVGNVQFDGNYNGTNNVRFTPAGGVGNIWELYPQSSGYGIFNRNKSTFPFFITNGDNIGIGTHEPENVESWEKVLEVKGTGHSKILTSTNIINTGIWSHDSGFYGAPAGGIAGTATNHPFSIMTGKNIRMVVTTGGDIGIGTINTYGYKLAVNGNIRAKEIKVEASPWPDYVFAKDYQLPTLQETEQHIKDKGHLPGIPSAAEVKANGVDLGDMNAKLLQKIEELTLHLIQQNKVLEEQKSEINALKAKVK